MGSNPSQFQSVGGSEMIESIEAFNDCSAFDFECCYGLDTLGACMSLSEGLYHCC